MTVEISDMTFDKVAIGPVSVRVYKGADFMKGAPVLLYFQGGAFLDAGLRHCPLAECLAGTGAIVVVPDYLSPMGGVFPKPLEVGFSLFSYLAKKRAGLGDRRSQLIIGGEESGGNVAAGVALKARDHYAEELDGQVLFSPLLDPFMGTASFRGAEAIGMRGRWSDGWSHYLSGGVCHPYAAPSLCSRLAGLAPALLVSSQDDPLRDETLAYAESLKAAGVAVRPHLLPEGLGWPSIHHGALADTGAWQAPVQAQFSSFLQGAGHDMQTT
ncbi:alpha/beta hydrolase fold domain-containing protein [Ensifer soli]|uniref:alpha/beta hydrolase fold domain-containing protein n=1 Tax=Ciceribacter sp. sgz301302 TaxID=3342379 RepID=UPI0035B9FDB9